MSTKLTPLLVYRDINGYPQTQTDDSRDFSTYNQDVALTTNTVNTIVVPSTFPNPNIKILAYFTFTPGATVFVLPAASPVLTAPSGTARTTLATLNPSGRVVVPGQTLQFLTAGTGVVVSVSYYALLGN